MGGRGPAPKPDSLRARRNVATSASVLPSQDAMRQVFRGRRGTKLPKHLQLPPRPDDQPWQPRTVEWWQDAVTSPMGTRYLDADLHGLYLAFAIIDTFYREVIDGPSRGHIGRLTMLATEVRQQIARYGLTPRDRLSLHWAIAEDEDQRSPRGGTPSPRDKVTDIRNVLGQEQSA